MRKPKGTKEYTKSGIEIKYLGEATDLSPEEIAMADRAIASADEEDQNCRVNFRWKKDQLDLVKAVADHIGIPYQAYIKQVLAERTAQDYAKIQAQPSSLKSPMALRVQEILADPSSYAPTPETATMTSFFYTFLALDSALKTNEQKRAAVRESFLNSVGFFEQKQHAAKDQTYKVFECINLMVREAAIDIVDEKKARPATKKKSK